jgi:eukaryotic-like serine/threonine-protein kinase
MAISSGTRLGPYEILSPLGAGGMGEVYKAKDTRLDRLVAIKVLPSHLSDDPDLKARFEREARAISSLSHPHICALYDVGSADGLEYLVMELLEGQTLADRLEKGALLTEQVLRSGIEIAGALDKAHRAGIVHRDLKPGNVMLTKSGVKLLDFGLAKTLAPGRAEEKTSFPTEGPRPLTEKGTIIGTVQYMAPEQLEGKDADARTDIFALGAVLHEMATGKKAFAGTSRASLIGAIMSTEPPPISSIQPMTPRALDHVVRRCLAKDPDERWQSAADVASELRWVAESGSQAGAPATVVSRRKSRERIAWLCAAVGAIAALFFAEALFRGARETAQVVRASILPPERARFCFAGDLAGPVAVSPDGRRIVFLAAGGGPPMLYLRAIDGISASPVPGTEDARFPFWSPDSRALGFFSRGKLRRIDVVAGGVPATICDAPNPRGGTWSRDGDILFEPDSGLPIYRVAATGGTPIPVTKVAAPDFSTNRWPVFLPDGKHFLYLAADHKNPRSEKTGVFFASLDGKENRLLVHTLSHALYSAGHLLFLRENSLLAQPFDPSSGRFLGDPTPVAEGVRFDLSTWHGIFSVSEQSIMAFQAGALGTSTRLIWYDRSGKVLGTLGETENFVGDVRISPDGRRVAASAGDPLTSVFIFDIASGAKTRLTFTPSFNVAAAWSPDGTQILLSSTQQKSGRLSVYVKPSGGTAPEQALLPESNVDRVADDWSRDGRYIAFNETTSGIFRGERIWLLPLFGDRKPFPLLSEHGERESWSVFSPDSRWVAFDVSTSGSQTVFVVPVRGSGGKWQVSMAGGFKPRWRGDGREIYYLAPDLRLMAAEVDGTGSEFRWGPVKPLFQTRAVSNPTYCYDVTPDGQRFLVNSLEEEESAPITLVVNWKAVLKR